MTPALPVAELAARLRRGEITSLRLVRDALERIEADRALGAYVTVAADEALAAAREADAELAAGRDRGPLHGLPVAVKDNVDTAAIRTTGGSVVYAQRVPARDAPVWAALRGAGAVLVGKTSLHELAYRAPHPAYPVARNPHDPARAPGGSSSGSAVAVAAGHVVAALGTDTGGSVRQPAAYCGVVGLKPSRGVLSRDGVIPLSRSLDAVGILAPDPASARIVLDALAPAPAPPRAGLRVGVVSDASAAACVREAVDAAAARLRDGGHDVVARETPALAPLRALHRTILLFEAYAEHRAVLDRCGPVFREAVRAGAAIDPARYRDAVAAREALRAEVLLGDADALLLPVTPDVAPPLDPSTGRAAGDADLTRWTFLASLFDLPAASVPAGAPAGLPVGVQLVCTRGGERALLDLAERVFARSRPPGAQTEAPRRRGRARFAHGGPFPRGRSRRLCPSEGWD